MTTKNVILVLPGLFGGAEAEPLSAFSKSPWLAFAEGSEVMRLRPLPDGAMMEWIAYGVNPEGKTIPDGPLLVASMRLEPPERSVHFRLSLASVGDLVAVSPPPPTKDEAAVLTSAISRLETRSLVPFWRHGLDHGLVWLDGSLDLMTVPICDLDGHAIDEHLPTGDGEAKLRRLIDDSVDLLSGLECNRVRREEGIPPLNLLWPWGFGFRPAIPNLALRRGFPICFVSESWRLQGLARLTGDWHAPDQNLTRGVHPDWMTVQGLTESSDFAVVLLKHAEAMRQMSRFDELDFFVSSFAEAFLSDLISKRGQGDTVFAVVAPGRKGNDGLAAIWKPGVTPAKPFPFDERIFGDRLVPIVDPWQPVRSRWEHR